MNISFHWNHEYNGYGVTKTLFINDMAVPAEDRKYVMDRKGNIDLQRAETWLQLRLLWMFLYHQHRRPVKAEGTSLKKVVVGISAAYRNPKRRIK